MTDRPLHPFPDERYFQHPIKGAILKDQDRIGCYVNDIGPDFESHEDDTHIYKGVEIHHSRCELGAWLTEQHPDDEHKLINHLFVEAVFPIKFADGDSAETVASLKRVDMAQSVINAGGDCTICGEPNIPDFGVEHAVGCEYMSWLLYVAAQAIGADQEPSLNEVVRAAQQQIARMQ